MRTLTRAVLCTALLVTVGTAGPGALFAADPPTLDVPATVTLPQIPGLAIIKPTTNCNWVSWHPLSPGIDVIPSDLLKSPIAFVAYVSQPGQVLAYAGNDLGPAPEKVVTITTATPPPPPPPTDPLAIALQNAYSADTGPTKAAEKGLLSMLFRAMALKVQIPANYATASDFYGDLNTRRLAIGVPATDFVAEWNLIVADLANKWTASQALDSSTRSAIAGELSHIADCLDSVNGTGKRRRH